MERAEPMTTTYRFDLVCPRCGKTSETTGTKKNPPPHVSCGDCLFDRVEVIEMKIVRVDVR
jgi:transcription elongation factor Elf1